MKYRFGIILLTFSLLLNSCSSFMVSKSKVSLIKGIWKTETAEGTLNNDKSLKAALEEARNTIYVFNDNMTAEIRVRNVINKTNWELDDDWLILKRENELMKFRMLELSTERMVLTGNYSGKEIKFTLIKIKSKS